ncbi:MAG: alpha/beta fold hydrolase [Vicinamibacterales bacterium]
MADDVVWCSRHPRSIRDPQRAPWCVALAAVLGFVAACSGPAATSSIATGDFLAEINGLTLWYRVAGRGPVCLMPTPAWGPSSDLYFRTLKPLEDYFTIVYLDSRGTGRSQRAPSRTDYTWQQLVADLDALRARLGQERIWLMGHSEGGAQVLHYAVSHPTRVNGLVLLDSHAAGTEAEEADAKARMERRSNAPWYSEAVRGLFAEPRSDVELGRNLDAALPLYWADPSRIRDHASHFAATSMSAEAAQGLVASGRFPFDLRPRLGSINAPTLVVVGADDFICSPAIAKDIHLGVRNSKLLLIEDSGHFPWLEQSQTFFRDVPRHLRALGLRTQ